MTALGALLLSRFSVRRSITTEHPFLCTNCPANGYFVLLKGKCHSDSATFHFYRDFQTVKTPRHRNENEYVTRVLSCVAGSLLLFVGIVRFWPSDLGEPDTFVYHPRGQEIIAIEEITPTSQQKQKPPPPRPLIPVVNDEVEILEDVDFDLADNYLDVDIPDDDIEETDGATANSGVQAKVDPRPVRVVEPEYTSEARRKNVKAEVVVEALIDERGRVQDVKIIEMYLLGKKQDDREQVSVLGYGLEESATRAASKWMFRPARNNGQAVSSYYVFSLKVGV